MVTMGQCVGKTGEECASSCPAAVETPVCMSIVYIQRLTPSHQTNHFRYRSYSRRRGCDMYRVDIAHLLLLRFSNHCCDPLFQN